MKKIAIQGIAGSFHHEAAIKFFKELKLIERKNFLRLSQAVKHKEADYGVMAIENSIAGAIIPNYNLILRYNLNIIGEVYLPVRLNLLALPGVELKEIKEVQSHRMALLESDLYLNQHPEWDLLEKYDTASASKELIENNLTRHASIGSNFVADLYHLNTLAENIQNTNYNYTRFFIIAKENERKTNFNKVSLMFRLKHEAGKLMSILKRMSNKNMNLTKIQSVPVPEEPFEYTFFADVLIPNKSDYFQLIELLDRATKEFRVLGEYQSGNFAALFKETQHLFGK